MGRRLQWLWLFGSFAAAAVSLAVEFYLGLDTEYIAREMLDGFCWR